MVCDKCGKRISGDDKFYTIEVDEHRYDNADIKYSELELTLCEECAEDVISDLR